jgi:type III secretion protein N (ATPase)
MTVAAKLDDLLPGLRARLDQGGGAQVRGRIVAIGGVLVRARLAVAGMGELCVLRDPRSGRELQAEVIGMEGEEVLLSPIGSLQGLSMQAEVIASGAQPQVAVGRHLLGRVIDPLGVPMDELGALAPAGGARYPLHAAPPPPLRRAPTQAALPTGIRAIDSMLTLARGQRMGLFGEAGVGKSSLLAALMRNVQVDVVVLALIGERGREVGDLLDRRIDAQTRQRTVAIVATSDRPATERVMAAHTATAIAEYFRDQGSHVLLLMDSVTRYARAQREVGLAAGEPPTRRGFPPSFFAALPRLLERAGCGASGSITGIYTILTEGDGGADPVAEETASILDGHLFLTRELAQRDHFPAIDVLRSRSRLMDDVIASPHARAAAQVREALARIADTELLRQVGEYRAGADARTDQAIRSLDAINAFLRQDLAAPQAFGDTVTMLQGLLA